MKNSFKNYKLDEKILRALDALGYTEPTEVQEKVIKEALLNKDLIVKSQTGTGKTASYVIPLCEKVNWEENNPEALILAPTRELAIQIGEDIKNIGRFKRIKPVCLYGKSPFKEQERELKGKTHMVAGTPGRVLDHIDRGTFDTSKIKYLVIDEADEMLNMGFIRQVEAVMRRLPKNKVTMLFSATLPEEIISLCKSSLNKPVNIEIQSENLVTKNIEHYVYKVEGREKLETLQKLLLKEVPDTAVIFCRTKDNVDMVYDFIKKLQFSVDKIHGGMLQKERTETMDRFKKGDFRILVATDVASRGIDVEKITHVINIDIPVEKEAYVHRIGRTGRAGKKGRAITFVTKYEEEMLKDICEYINYTIAVHDVNELNISKAERNKNKEALKRRGKVKALKERNVNKGITKLYFNGGKKKKIRAVDFVGTISNLEGLSSDDIGIIDIQDQGSYVEILNGKGKRVLDALKNKTIKGKKLRVEIARK
ncbi:MAG: DEAD/DEAH box helicase [Clostridiaceae bacterium]|nr:DEAD/DEAH box helicase [Clostridiaceae bacterium]